MCEHYERFTRMVCLEVGGYFVPECHICGLEVPKEDCYYCGDCGEFTCNSCGDGDLCELCLEDEAFFLGIMD